MTFYNIIFGLLFIGAFREVVFALSGGPDWRLFCLAGTLSMLVFSDTIYTSLVIEGKKKRYRAPMKLLDLWSFILLSFAVVVLNPKENDLFEVDVTKVLNAVTIGTGWNWEALFWGLLTLYMINLVVWNSLLSIRDVMWRDRWVKWVQPALVLLFALMTAAAWVAWGASAKLSGARWFVFFLILGYLLGFKPYMARVLDNVVTLKPLTDEDVRVIRTWPPYTKRLDVLDYALRKDGWLDQYPRSPTNERYGIWQKGELVGFSLLTDIEDGDAEFYIALRADKTRGGIGHDGTANTVRRGFQELGLKRIRLRVRDWHDGARRLYERVGFRKYDESDDPIQGKLVKFVCMDLYRPKPSLKDRWKAFLAAYSAAVELA